MHRSAHKNTTFLWPISRLSKSAAGFLLSPVHTGDKVDYGQNWLQIGDKVDCHLYDRLCCRYSRLCRRFWRQIGNSL